MVDLFPGSANNLLLDQGLPIEGLVGRVGNDNLCQELNSTKSFNGPVLIGCGLTFFAADAPILVLLVVDDWICSTSSNKSRKYGVVLSKKGLLNQHGSVSIGIKLDLDEESCVAILEFSTVILDGRVVTGRFQAFCSVTISLNRPANCKEIISILVCNTLWLFNEAVQQ